MRLLKPCPICSKPLELVSSLSIGENNQLNTFKCGHVFSSTVVSLSSIEKESLDFLSIDGSKQARDYQKQGVEFIIESNFNCIIADQMRLGKTPQSLLALKNRLKEKTPCLILVRSANLWQWTREFRTWVTELPNGIFPIIGTKGFIFPGFSAYIMSMDTFSRKGMTDQLLKLGIRLLIVDEAHSFKNTDSNRSQSLVEFITRLNEGEMDNTLHFTCSRCAEEWDETGKIKFDKRIGHKVTSKSSTCPKCQQYCYIQQQHGESEKYTGDPEINKKIKGLLALSCDTSTTLHERISAKEKAEDTRVKYHIEEKKKRDPVGVVLLTGTPIKNRADEYFIPLNLIAPEKFPSLARFQNEWLVANDKGKYTRIDPYRLDSFKKLIKPYVLRREKEDVFKELPKINRIFTVIEPDKDALVNSYNKILDKLETKLAEKVNPSFWDMADELTTLRRICGLMKVPFTSDYLETSLVDESKERYAVGIHHKDVRDMLYYKLGSEKNCFKLSGEDSAENKDRIMRNFETSSQRVLIINMLAGGVGMDFHYVNNVLILERQWSSADEEQFEFRFYNPDLKIKTASTTCEYIIIKGSIEQFFFDLVEDKRKIFGETIANHFNVTQDSTSFRELMEMTVSSRL